METIIEIEDLRVQSGTTQILHIASFRIHTGEFWAMIGPNGAGKTTMLKALLGLVPFGGMIRILGVELAKLSPFARARLRRAIGYVPQLHDRPAAVLPLSAQQVIELGAVVPYRFRMTVDAQKSTHEVIKEMELATVAERPVTVLSGGELRKVHLARALAQQPRLLLLDEPTSYLDFKWQEQIIALLDRVYRQHRLTILMVTHDLRHLPPSTTHVAVLKNGKLVAAGKKQDVLQSHTISEIFETSVNIIQKGQRYFMLPSNVQ